MNWHELSRDVVFAALGIVVSVVRYGTYIWSIYRKETRPHVFSWLNWGVVVGIGAYAQFRLDGGPSTWVLVLVAVSCIMISVLALFVGEKDITRSDWAAFIGAFITVGFWQMTRSPAFALVCIVMIDCLSYWPTLRKSWRDPWGEPPTSYFWAGLRYFFALLAVPSPHLSNLFYPFFLMATDWGFMAYVIARRKYLGAPVLKVRHKG